MKTNYFKKLLKLFGSVVLLLFVFFFYSCTNLNLESNDKNDFFVSKDIAAAIALNIDRSEFPSGKDLDLTLLPDNPEDLESLIIKGLDGKPAFYVFNYGNDLGYCIISADYRLEPVLAFVPEGNGLSVDSPVPSGFNVWLSSMQHKLQFIEKNEKEDEKEYEMQLNRSLSLWAEFTVVLNKYDLFYPVIIFDPIKICYFIEYDREVVGPLIETRWGQGCAYNQEILGIGCDVCNGHPLTGCVATAMAQVVRYWAEPSSRYSFNNMPNNTGNRDVQLLMRDCGTAVNMSYGCSGSGAQTANIASSLTTSPFNYSSAQHINYNRTILIAELRNEWPVVLSGFRIKQDADSGASSTGFQDAESDHELEYVGHAWVADGYKRRNSKCTTEEFFHMNWGWDGISNGWFLTHDWTVGNRNYEFFRGMVHNIQP